MQNITIQFSIEALPEQTAILPEDLTSKQQKKKLLIRIIAPITQPSPAD